MCWKCFNLRMPWFNLRMPRGGTPCAATFPERFPPSLPTSTHTRHGDPLRPSPYAADEVQNKRPPRTLPPSGPRRKARTTPVPSPPRFRLMIRNVVRVLANLRFKPGSRGQVRVRLLVGLQRQPSRREYVASCLALNRGRHRKAPGPLLGPSMRSTAPRSWWRSSS